MPILRFSVGDRLEMKKPHPCGSRIMRIARTGSEVRVICEGCGRDMVLDRIKVEKATKTVLPPKDTNS